MTNDKQEAQSEKRKVKDKKTKKGFRVQGSGFIALLSWLLAPGSWLLASPFLYNGQRTPATGRCFFVLLLMLLLTACGGAPALSQQTASYTVQLTLDALAVGDRTAMIEVRDQSGQPVDAEQITVTPTMLSMGMASPEVAAQPSGAGRYTGEKLFISMTGDWELDVKIQASGTTEIARFTVTVPTQ